MRTQEFVLNMIPGYVNQVVHVSQYDHDVESLVIHLVKGGEVYSIPSLSTVTISGTKPDGLGFTYTATWDGSTVTADVTEQMTAVAGSVVCELRITSGSDVVGSQNFILEVEEAALNSSTATSATDIPLLEDAVAAAVTATTAASTIFGTGSQLAATVDLNTITTGGKYYMTPTNAGAGTASNCPTRSGFAMLVYASYNVARPVQIIYDMSADIYIRAQNGGSSWTSWKKVTTTAV